MIRIGSRRQAPHAEPLAGMKMFRGKGAVPAAPASVVRHGMRLHRPVIPLNRLPRKDCHGRGRIKRHPIQKNDLRIPRLAQSRRQDKHQPAKKRIEIIQRGTSFFQGRHPSTSSGQAPVVPYRIMVQSGRGRPVRLPFIIYGRCSRTFYHRLSFCQRLRCLTFPK